MESTRKESLRHWSMRVKNLCVSRENAGNIDPHIVFLYIWPNISSKREQQHIYNTVQYMNIWCGTEWRERGYGLRTLAPRNSMVINCNSLHETLLRMRQKCLCVNGEYAEKIYAYVE